MDTVQKPISFDSRLLFGRCLVRILVSTPTIQTQAFHGFRLSLKAHVGIVQPLPSKSLPLLICSGKVSGSILTWITDYPD
jgi:hypothetical protein